MYAYEVTISQKYEPKKSGRGYRGALRVPPLLFTNRWRHVMLECTKANSTKRATSHASGL